MANRLYKRHEIPQRLAYCRLYSYKPEFRTQKALAKALGTSPQRLSEIENGIVEPNLELAARWCRITGHHEQWDIIKNAIDLEPFAVPPVHPEFNQRLSDAMINLFEELPEAMTALEEMQRIWNNRRPGKPFDARPLLNPAKQLFDVFQAIKTIMFAAEREAGLSNDEVARIWSQDAVSKEIVPPKMDMEIAMAR